MLTSSNQYIRPEYLTPLPNTFDSKNSPLALLAQTCSAIGADASPNPKLLANIEKNSKSSSTSSSSGHHKSQSDSRDKLSPGSNSTLSNSSSSDTPKSSFKPYESNFRDKTKSPDDKGALMHHQHATSPALSMSSMSTNAPTNRIKTPKSSQHNLMQQHQQQQLQMQQQQHSHQLSNSRCDSNQSATSPRSSPANSSINHNNNNNTSSNNSNIRKTPNSIQDRTNSPNRASSKDLASANSHTTTNGSRDTPPNSHKDMAKDMSTLKSSAPTMPITSTASPFLSGYPTHGLPYPMDLMTASALMSPHHSMLKAAALSPYLNYARMKVPGAAESMMSSVCRDPYCTGCALSPHMMGKSNGSCPAGCTQCDHPGGKTYSQQLASAQGAAAAYAHAQLAALAAASQLPYVCNWIAGDSSYCGKRFGTSEELFQHLRTQHTTSSMSESMLNPAVAAAAAAASGLPPSHPLFQRTYPTPPLSPLSTARYHPYSKPSMMPSLGHPSLSGLPGMPPHPSLAQYFSPYSLYGSRLGQQPSMHP